MLSFTINCLRISMFRTVSLNFITQFFQALSQQFMIIASQGITTNVAELRIIQRFGKRGFGGQIIHPNADDPQRAREQFVRTCAQHAMTGHPLHFAMVLFIKPCLQFWLFSGKVGIANTHLLKAKGLAPLLDEVGQLNKIKRECHTNQSEKRNTPSLPHSVFSADWLRQAESLAAQETGISLFTLMQRAAAAAFHLARTTFPATRHWLVLCGHGNNGGDGYEMARLAKSAGINVTLLAVKGHKPLPEEAQAAKDGWLNVHGTVENDDTHWPPDIDLIIDGLLGTGLVAAPRTPYDSLIAAINRSEEHS